MENVVQKYRDESEDLILVFGHLYSVDRDRERKSDIRMYDIAIGQV